MTVSLDQLRTYRIQLETPFFNNTSSGIALFDLVLSFVGAYIVEHYFKLSDKLPGKNKLTTYYLLVIPLGLIIHFISARLQHIDEFTFLNKKIFSFDLNIYKVLLMLNLFLIYVAVFNVNEN